MPWYIYSLARGSVFFWGAAALALAVVLRSQNAGRGRRILFVLTTVLAAAMIAISAAAVPFFVYGIWVIATLAWLIRPWWETPRNAIAIKGTLLLVTGAAVVLELSFTLRPSPPPGSFPRLYVVGDSISAGLGDEHGKTWPVLIATQHHVNVVDLSQAGATISEASKRVERTPLSDGLVFLEIGGNDMLSHADPSRFSDELESLVIKTEGAGRKLVMLELPLLPFDNAYGVVQRKISSKHHITLIPKRFFVDVLQTPGATVDGIHLSAAGQRQLAEIIWTFIGNNLRQDGSTTLPAS